MTSNVVPARSAIPREQTWNEELVFRTREQWRSELESAGGAVDGLVDFAGTVGNSPETLGAWLVAYQDVSRRVEKLAFYAYMASAVDTGDSEAVAMVGQSQSLESRFAAASSFAVPDLLGMDESVLRSWVEANESLRPVAHYLEDIFRMKAHYRSGDIEEVLGLVSDPFRTVSQTFEMLSNNDMKFADAGGPDGATLNVTQSNIEAIKRHEVREVRRTGMNNYADAYLAHRHTFATNYIAAAKQAHVLATVRGHDSVLERVLSPHNLPASVFYTLIDTFQANLPVWHRYWDVKRRLLKLDKMRPYDIWAPLTSTQPTFSFEEAVETVATGMAPLGQAYTSALRRGCLEERWVDYAQNQNKAQGAFSYGTYDTNPCILTNFDASLSEVSTLAHELGHSMHSLRTWQSQLYLYADYSEFIGEVASNFNQAMVRDSLFKSSDDRDFQLAVIQEAMENFHRYFFIMPTLARFEYSVYGRLQHGEPLNADVLQELMASLFAQGYGETLSDDAERTSITWATFSHLYVPFYTFQYATGISAAYALCNGVLSGGADARDRYLEFLSIGNSMYALDALEVAGVDMTSSAPIEAAFAALGGLIDRLESLIE